MSEVILCLRGHPAVVRETPTVTREAGYVDSPDHVQRDEVAPDLRVPHVPQSLTNTGLRKPICRLSRLTVYQHFCRLGFEMHRPLNFVRWPGLTSAKPVNHVF